MDIIVVEHNEDGEIHTNAYTMFPTIIDKTCYMNVQRKDLKKGQGDYIFIKYEISQENTLTLWMLNTEKIRELIEEGIIRGEVIARTYEDTIKMTETTPNFAKHFSSTKHDELFDESLGRFQKIR